MKIEEIRKTAKMSQRAFATYFGIPLGTLRNWEQNISQPPPYVIDMIYQSIRRDKMINFETIELMSIIIELADLSKNGIEEFTNASEHNKNGKIYYDKNSMDEDGNYRVAHDVLIDYQHHDIVSYYDTEIDEYSIRAVIPDTDNDTPYIMVKFHLIRKIIVIENGKWYFV